MLWDTRITLSFGGSDTMIFVNGSMKSENEGSCWTWIGLIPDAPKSRAVTLWPEDLSNAATLYQDHAPWPASWINTKCFFPTIGIWEEAAQIYDDSVIHDWVALMVLKVATKLRNIRKYTTSFTGLMRSIFSLLSFSFSLDFIADVLEQSHSTWPQSDFGM